MARVSNDEVLRRIGSAGVIPVVTLPSVDDAAPLCEALLDGGLSVVEVTFRTEAVAAAIAAIAERYPEMLVGAGTVTDTRQVALAAAAGARFGVSPGTSPAVVRAAHASGLVFWPGVCTPTEIERALDLGVTTMKFFPAGALGGADVVRAMLAPYLHLGVRLIPTGQIDDSSAPEYWALHGVVAVGGSWIAPTDLIAEGAWDEISRRARAATVRYRALRGEYA